MIEIDGGRGGGQILRSSLTLSLITGQGFSMANIRGKRSKPGLGRQHLACVQAALEISDGVADGVALGSRELVFRPGRIRGGDYHIPISTAGSTTLVFQTLALALLRADEASTLVIEGGTHNPLAPPVPFIEEVYLPVLRRMGAKVDLALDRFGFAPAGGGQVTAKVEPSDLTPISIEERGPERSLEARILTAHLGDAIAERERRTLADELGWERERIHLQRITDSAGPGNVILVSGRWEHASELVTAHGKRGRSSEAVAKDAAKDFTRYQNAGLPVGCQLADQLLLPFALAGAGRFRTLALSDHFETNRGVIEAFLPLRMRTVAESPPGVLVEVVRDPPRAVSL